MARPASDTTVKQSKSTKVNHLAHINADVFTTILSFLDIGSMASLEQTCTYVRDFIQQFGWTRLLNSDLRALNEDHVRKGHSIPAKEILRINLAWKSRTFLVTQCDLDNAAHGKMTEGGNTTESISTSVPFCQLHMLSHGLILLMGSEMRYWPNAKLQKRQPITMENCLLFKMENPANLDKRWIAQHQRRKSGKERNKNDIRASAVWDICASAVLNKQGTLIALARVNGLIEIVQIEVRKSGMQARVHLAWFWPDQMNSNVIIQTLASCPNSGLLAICGKQGEVWLVSVRKRESVRQHKVAHGALDIRPLSYWKVEDRIWSACFAKTSTSHGYPSWIAIGTGGREGVLIYSLKASLPERIATLHCNGRSIYSIKTDNMKCSGGISQILHAGCFDGKLRTFDVTKAISIKETNAVSVMYDKYDPSAMYCLLTGTGQDGMQIAAGTARHGVVKMFDVREALNCTNQEENTTKLPDKNNAIDMPDIERQGWSMFAAHPSRSPTYSLAGGFDRIFGVTDQKLWQVDLRNRAGDLDQISSSTQLVNVKAKKDYEMEKGKLAYYRHSDMLLEHSNLPTWIAK